MCFYLLRPSSVLSDFLLTYLRRGVSSHHLLHLYLPSVCFPPELLCWSTNLISTKSRTKFFLLLLLVCRCPFLTSVSLVTHTQCLKIAKVVERDLRDVNLRET